MNSFDREHLVELLVGAAVVVATVVIVCAGPAHADIYFALTDGRYYLSAGAVGQPELPVEHCRYKVIVNGEEFHWLNGLRLNVAATGVVVGDELVVSLQCAFVGRPVDEAFYPALGNPYVAAPATDPNEDGCWRGVRDIIALRRDGLWLWERYKWLHILGGKCLVDGRVWE